MNMQNKSIECPSHEWAHKPNVRPGFFDPEDVLAPINTDEYSTDDHGLKTGASPSMFDPTLTGQTSGNENDSLSSGQGSGMSWTKDSNSQAGPRDGSAIVARVITRGNIF